MPQTSLAQLAWWLAWATLAGSVLQVAAQLPEVVRLIGVVRPTLDRTAEGLAQTLRNLGRWWSRSVSCSSRH